jgi:hypothetical protein
LEEMLKAAGRQMVRAAGGRVRWHRAPTAADWGND